MYKYKYIIFILLSVISFFSLADESDVDVTISPAYDGVAGFVVIGQTWLEQIQTADEAAWYFNAVLLSAIVIKSVSALTLYIFKKIDLGDVIVAFMMIIITFSFFHSFGYAVEATYGWTRGITGLIQEVLLGTDDVLYTSNIAAEISKKLVFEDYSFLVNPIALVKMAILAVLIALFEVALFFIDTWVTIGVVLSQLLGIFMIPFLLFKPTAYIFDGWVKMYVGFLAFGLVGKVISIIVIQILLEFFGWTVADLEGNASFTVSLTSTGALSWLSLIGIFFIAILMLFSTTKIASLFAGGAAGLGDGITGAARGLAAMKGFKG